MKTRKIPSTGEDLPVIGLGTWQQFDVDPTSAVVPDLMQVLDQMQYAGARLIDSSPMYGRSEQMVGELTSKTEASHFFYATKVWTSGKEEGIRQMEESMAKMKREVMDLMQVHNLLDVATHLETLKAWKAEGKIRYIGVTHYTVAYHQQLEEVIKSQPIDFVQFNYSIESRNAEKRLLSAATDKGVAVIINEPLEKGAVFLKTKGKAVPEWAKEAGMHNWSSFFLKYIISHPSVTCIIPGTSNPEHMADILSAGEGDMPDATMREKMEQFYDNL